MLKKLLLASCLALVGAGCSTMQYTANPQGTESGVRVLYEYPKSPYKNLGLIDFDYYQPGWKEPTVTDALPQLKAKVGSVGGNALIVRNQRIGQRNNRFITVSAEVLNVDWSRVEP